MNNTGLPVFEVLKPGLLTTIQDLGRPGYQCFGVSCAGAMDCYALRIANRLLGNPEGCAALEITLHGPRLRALTECAVAITGGELSPSVDGKPVESWECLHLDRGQFLSFGSRRRGARAYLAVAGGFSADCVLGSRSTDMKSKFGGLEGRSLRPGDILSAGGPLAPSKSVRKRPLPPDVLWEYQTPFTLRVTLGPQSGCLPKETLETFLSTEFKIMPDSNRMGYRLDGAPIQATPAEIISEPVALGALQVLPNGQLVLLMAERQTVGGYPKIAVVISADIPKAAQLGIGHRVRFGAVTLDEAYRLLHQQEAKILRVTGGET